MNKTSITDAMRLCMHREPALRSPIPAPAKPLARVLTQIPMPDSGGAPAGGLKPTEGVSFTVWGPPIGKPRQTQRDKWQKRPCVVRYRMWADKARAAAGEMRGKPIALKIFAFLPMPKSWSQRKREDMTGRFHRQKPDFDNIQKAVADALFSDDSTVAMCLFEKRWDDGKGPRVEITVL